MSAESPMAPGARGARRRLPYAGETLKAVYPGVEITNADKQAIDEYRIDVRELLTRPELVLYGLERTFTGTIAGMFEAFAQVAGPEVTRTVAYEVGKRYGALNYSAFLRNRGLSGGPRDFCHFQDYMHAVKGPRHSKALFATYDETSVIVDRTDCVFSDRTPNPYIAAMEEGMYGPDGAYASVDPTYSHAENPRCLCKGSSDGCLHRFVFKPSATAIQEE